MSAAVVDKEQERGGSFVNTITRYAKIYYICKIWQRIMQISGGFYSIFEDFICLPMLQASQRALAKMCKGRNTLFLCYTIKIDCWTLQERVLAASSSSLQAVQSCWTQLISHIRSLPGNIAFLWRFPSCTFAILQHLHLVLLCCHLCSGEKREFVYQGEKMYTVFSVRHWAINLSMTTDAFCLRVNIKKLWNAHVMRCTNNVIWELFLIWHSLTHKSHWTGLQKYLNYFLMEQCIIKVPFLLLLHVV